jgi:uncharacterized protein YbjT (DUF2867 family)
MKVVIFGASGLIGDGMLQESLNAVDVDEVITVGRAALDKSHPKLRSVVHNDFLDFTPIVPDLDGVDACFWALGVSSVGVKPQEYELITVDYTAAAARTLVSVNPELTFVFVSGAGTDGTGHGRRRWARVKGRAENMIIATFRHGYGLRPGFIRPAHHMQPRTPGSRWITRVGIVVAPVLRLLGLAPAVIVTTVELGQAALHLARNGYSRRVLENREIVELASAAPLR